MGQMRSRSRLAVFFFFSFVARLRLSPRRCYCRCATTSSDRYVGAHLKFPPSVDVPNADARESQSPPRMTQQASLFLDWQVVIKGKEGKRGAGSRNGGYPTVDYAFVCQLLRFNYFTYLHGCRTELKMPLHG